MATEEICACCGTIHPTATIEGPDARGEYLIRYGDQKQAQGDDFQIRHSVGFWMDCVWCLEHQLAAAQAALACAESRLAAARAMA